MATENAPLHRLRWLASTWWEAWSTELAIMFPRCTAWLGDTRGKAVLRLDAEATTLGVSGATGNGSGPMTLNWPNELLHLDALQQQQLASACEGCLVEVVMAARDVQYINTRLPMAAAASDEAVGYALITDAPLSLEALAYGWRPRNDSAPSSAMSGWMDIKVALCRRTRLDAIDAFLASAGIVAQRIGANDVDLPGALAYTMRYNRPIGAHWLRAQRRKLLVASAVCALLLGPFVVGGWASWQARQLRLEQAQLRVQQSERGLTPQRRARVEALALALKPLVRRPPGSSVLNELARVTPADTWLLEFRLDGNQLKLVGHASNPIAATRNISETSLLENVRLDSVNSAALPDGGSAFELTATVRTQP